MANEDEMTLEDEGSEEQIRKSRFRRRRKKALDHEELEEPRRRRSLRRRKDKKDYEVEEGETSQGRLWLEQNWKTMLALFLIFLFGLFLRSYFYYPPATEDGFILSGNDPYYHKRVVDYVQENHRHLIFDPMLSYPDGALNPRPPMFDWSVAILGMLLSPLFGGDVGVSTWQVMEFSPAFWGALTAIPVYLIGKEMFNRKVGLICALLLATMPSHVERSPLGFSDHDAMVLFFVVLSFFFFIKALNSLVIRDKWVTNWLHPKEIPKGLKEWFKHNQISVAFSLLSGLSLASIALIWKGFLYPVVIIIVYFFTQMILNKLRNKDSLGVALCTIITLAVIAIIPIPYYNGNRMPYIIEPAMEILIAVIIVSAVLVPTRDSPWVLVFSTLAVVLVCGFILLIYVFPEIGSTYFSGQGYFVKNKIFSTIAEAQAPDYSRAMFSYGVVTTFLALYALLISIIRVVKDLKAHYLFMTIWGITSVYMAISATRFIFNAGPIFAILSGWMVYEIIKKLDFRKMMKHYRSLKGGGRFYAMKKSVKVSHIVGVLFLIFMILIPNLWLGWDAGIPFGEKKSVDVAVYNALPWFMKPEEYNADEAANKTRYPDGVGTMYNKTNMNELKYFGAFGHGFPSDYWLDGMRWLSEQDTDLPMEERPGFISWWDYGFWSIYLGHHPTAADNFQGHVQYAGSFISAKNESQGVSLLITRILEADISDYRYEDRGGDVKLHEGVKNILVKYFGQEKASDIEDVLINPPKYRNEVLNNPDRYGYYTSDMAVEFTPMYAILQTWIPELLTDDERIWLLHELQDETGYSLRYFAIDSRLFPFGPQNTGIFYAPLKLSDHRIDDNNEPFDFIRTIIKASDGREYSIEDFIDAQEKNEDLKVTEYILKYYEPFLESMLLKCYIGYTLEDIGTTDTSDRSVEPNLPGVHTSNYPPMQGWMMKHFQLVYRTAHWNPYNSTEYKYHPDAWEAMSQKDANDLVEKLENDGIDNDKNGEVDDRGEGGVVSSGLRSGVVFLKYYEGAYLNGTVKTTKGSPVPNLRVTVLDDYGIPHDTTFTDENGEYHLIAPSGNVSIDVSTGGFTEGEYQPYSMLSQVEELSLNSTKINISDDQVMRRMIDEDGDGIWDYNIVQDFEIEPSIAEGRVFWDNDTNGEYNENFDLNISQTKVTVFNPSLDMEYSVMTNENGTYIFDDLTSGTYEISVEVQGHNITLEETIDLETEQKGTKDIGIKPGYLQGKINSTTGDNLIGEEIRLLDKTNETTSVVYTDSDGNYSYKWLLPGNYTIDVNIDGFESYQKELSLAEGYSINNNITLSPSTDVEGRTYNAAGGNTIGNVTIKFKGLEENQGLTKFARSNETGFYVIDLKNGRYQIQVKHDLGEETPYIYLGEIDVRGGVVTHDLSLEKGFEVFGTVYRDHNNNSLIDPREVRPYAQVSFENSNVKSTITANSTGYYRDYLPLGDYSVYATFESEMEPFLGKLSVISFDRVEYNIELNDGEKFEGFVYYDVDKNDLREESEGLSYATITFTDESAAYVRVTADEVGRFSLNLETDKNFSVIAERSGFNNFNLPLMNFSEITQQSYYKMIPLNITTYGTTQYESVAKENVSITFEAVERTGSLNASTTSNPTTGYYSLDLSPGDYRVIVDHNTTENGKPVRFLFDDIVHIEVGEGSKELNLNMTKKIKINGTVNGTSDIVTITFESMDGEVEDVTSDNGSFEIFLIPREYTIKVDHEVNSSTHYVYLDTFDFNESQTLELNLSLGIKVEGKAKYDGDGVQGIQITFKNNGSLMANSAPNGDYTVFLPPNRTYEVIINQTEEENNELVKFTFSTTLDVNTTDVLNWDIELTKFVKVKGQVYIDWDDDNEIDTQEGVENITINFENGDTVTAVSGESGGYEIFLLLENKYNITMSSDFPIVDEGFNITVTMIETKKDFSITPANLTLSGTTLRDGSTENYTALWFWALSSTAINTSTISNEVGDYSVDLPHGEYVLYARKVSGSNVFVYLDEISLKPRENLVIDLNLTTGTKVNGKAYYINSTGENLSSQTIIDFEGVGKVSTPSNENGQFEVWLPSGNYLVTSELAAFEYNRSMNYTYENFVEITNDMELYLKMNKIEVSSVELEWLDTTVATIQQNESVTYNVSIKNTGNIEQTFDISYSSDVGWNISLPDNITLGIDESKIFEVHIQASTSAIVEHKEVTVIAVSRSPQRGEDELELKVNITQVYEAANLSLGITPIIARNNTLEHSLIITNIGNGKDNFTLSLSGSPEDWNVTLSSTELTLASGESRIINLTIIIPYNSTTYTTTLTLTANSSINLTSTMDISVELSNLKIEEEDITVTGEQVSEGALKTEPIPGFETLVLLASLIAVAFIMRRRNAK